MVSKNVENIKTEMAFEIVHVLPSPDADVEPIFEEKLFIKEEIKESPSDMEDDENPVVTKSKRGQVKKEKPERVFKKPRYFCDVEGCNEYFIRLDFLEGHKRWHQGLKPGVCTICGKEFNKMGLMVRHVERHNKSKRFPCTYPDCGKSFHTKNLTRIHYRLCHEPKKFSCQKCGKTFSNAAALRRHIDTHSDAKNFE